MLSKKLKVLKLRNTLSHHIVYKTSNKCLLETWKLKLKAIINLTYLT